MDPDQQPTDAQPVDQADAAASDQPQEAESSFFNRMIRGLAGVVRGGRDDESSERDAEQQDDAAPTADEAEQQPTVQPTYTQADFDRAVQSRSDALLARRDREHAVAEADRGNLQPLRNLAERDPWAERQLAKNGDTWAVGEQRTKQLLEQEARENDPLPALASSFDQAILHPILGALPKEDEEKIVGQGLTGFDGRQQAVTQAIARLKTHAAAEGIAKALDDEGYVTKLLGDSAAFRLAILRHPVLSKQLRAMFRGDLVEPDLNPGSGPGRGGTRENDVMNDYIRGLASDAEARGPTERAAGAGARNRRAVNLDLLDDDV